MNRIAAFTGIVGTLLCLYLPASPAYAQASRTWVSGVGDDANPCSRTAPCKTFAGAISKTAADGEINCLDPGGFGALTITKSIIIDCHEVFASVLVSGTNGIVIVSDNTAAKNVRLRNINFTGLGTGLSAILIQGGTTSNTAVSIEDCWMDDFAKGIADTRSGGGKLMVSNTTGQNIIGAAVSLSGTSLKVSIDNLRAFNSGFGVAVGTGNTVMINRSTIAGAVTSGLETEGTASVNVDNSTITNGALGVQVVGGTVRLSNTDVSFNTTGFSGTVNSFTNNRFTGNGAGGTITAITPAGTNPSGQQ